MINDDLSTPSLQKQYKIYIDYLNKNGLEDWLKDRIEETLKNSKTYATPKHIDMIVAYAEALCFENIGPKILSYDKEQLGSALNLMLGKAIDEVLSIDFNRRHLINYLTQDHREQSWKERN